MILLAVFLIAAGLVMICKPALIWTISEKWKSSGADGPSSLYLWSIRFGGILCTSIGLAYAIVLWFNPS